MPASQVVVQNVRARTNKRVAADLLKIAREPEVKVLIALETQGGFRNAGGKRLDAFAKGIGWRRVTGKGPVGASAQIFIRPGVELIDSGVHLVPTRWRGPKSRTRNQKGRAFPWVIVRLEGRPTLVIGTHLPWGPRVAMNRAAWRDCVLWLRRMFDAYQGVDVIAAGDMNISPDAHGEHTLQWLALEVGGHIVRGSGIDYALFRPARVGKVAYRPRPRNVTARSLGRLGSDHPAIAVTL